MRKTPLYQKFSTYSKTNMNINQSGWEKSFDDKFDYGVLSGNDPDEDITDDVKSFIRQELARQKEEDRKKYDQIFKWLLGKNGDFPDLSQKPHYSFRTELRKRLDAVLKILE